MTSRPFAEAGKRVLDLLVALLLAPPALLVGGVFALLIRAETPGGAIFRQTRVGRRGARFTVLKLRTMVEDAEHKGAGLYADPGDARFTRVGVLARRLSVDELPQLVNVLRGEMSIVGPRPMLPVTVEEHAEAYREILKVKPGLTGLAQVSGRNDLPRSQRLLLDRQYANGWTLLGDLVILAKTVRVVLFGAGQRNAGRRQDVER